MLSEGIIALKVCAKISGGVSENHGWGGGGGGSVIVHFMHLTLYEIIGVFCLSLERL